ncbi:MAG: hypothetical protein LUH57_03060 [Ruminococcus sp.]|nr:hypothetical protein [Ruminococcus sp.]
MPEFIKRMSRKAKIATISATAAAVALCVSLCIYCVSFNGDTSVTTSTDSVAETTTYTDSTTQAADSTEEQSTSQTTVEGETTASAEEDDEQAELQTTTATVTDVNGVVVYDYIEEDDEDSSSQTATISEGDSSVATSKTTKITQSSETTEVKTFTLGYNLSENMLSDMTDDEKEVLYTLLNAIENHETQVSIKSGVIKNGDTDTLNDLFVLVKIALAKTDMLSPTYVYSGGEYVTNITLTYRLTENEVAAQRAQLKSKIKSIMSGVTDDMDDYDKLLYFHDEIISYCSYDLTGDNIRSAYGCLVEGSASCEGYSKALLELCDQAGIDCVIVTGSASSNSQTIKHMWNKVRISGRWYNVDLSWDDSGSGSGYDWFLVTDKELEDSHTAEENTFYTCPSAVFETDNYFVKNGFYVRRSDYIEQTVKSAVEAALIKGDTKASIKLRSDKLFEEANELFSDSNAENPIFDILKEVSAELGVSVNTSSVYKSVNEQMRIITFEISQ